MSGKLNRRRRTNARRGARDDRRPTRRMWFETGHLADLQGHGQVGEPADVTGMDTNGIGLIDLVAFDPFEQLGQRDPGFHPGQVRTQTEVRTATETQ